MSTTTLAAVPATWTWFFDTEEEAHMFALGYKDELANEEYFQYEDHSVEYDLKAGAWKLSFRFWDLNPVDPDDAPPAGRRLELPLSLEPDDAA